MAIQASAPEIAPGTAVTLTPLLSDVTALGGRNILYTAVGCTDPGVSQGATPSCASAPDLTDLVPGTGTILAGTLAAPTYTGAATVINVPGAVTTNILATNVYTGQARTAAEQYNGVAYLVVYSVSVSGGPSVSSFKRIYVSNKTPKNTNPTVSDITSSGSSYTALGSGKQTLVATTSGAEAYQIMLSDGVTLIPQTESLTTTWFTSDGSFDFIRTAEPSSNGYNPPSSGHPVIAVVVRDARGGESFLVRGL